MTGLWLISYVVLWICLLIVAIILISALRNLGVVYSLLSSLPEFASTSANRSSPPKPSSLTVGDELPNARLVTASGESRTAYDFRGSKMAFALVSPSCGSCAIFLEHLPFDGPDPLDESLRDFVVISLGSIEQTAQLQEKSRPSSTAGVLFDSDGEVEHKWGIAVTPGTVIVDEHMRVVRQVFGGKELMELRAERATEMAGVS